MTRPSVSVLRGCALSIVTAVVLAVTACESEPKPAGNRPVAPNANSDVPPPGTPGSPLVLKHSKDNPIAVSPSEFPGVEARLTNVSRSGQLLLVEIELVNTSPGPVTINDYSAAGATFIDDVLKQPVEPVDTGQGPTATVGLTRTLQPGESATVSASFPVGAKSRLATLTFPKLGIFTAIEIETGSRYRSKTREEFNAEQGVDGSNRRSRNANAGGAK